MSTISRIFLSLAVFLGVAWLVYAFTSHERGGSTLLLVNAATLCFLGLIARTVAREEAESGGDTEEEPHVGPTIWPFGFAIAAVIIALGLIVTTWLLIPGAIMFALSAAGWLREVTRSRAHVGQH